MLQSSRLSYLALSHFFLVSSFFFNSFDLGILFISFRVISPYYSAYCHVIFNVRKYGRWCSYCIYCYNAGITSSTLQQKFMENLLGTYRELERSFIQKLLRLHKALGFSTL